MRSLGNGLEIIFNENLLVHFEICEAYLLVTG